LRSITPVTTPETEILKRFLEIKGFKLFSVDLYNFGMARDVNHEPICIPRRGDRLGSHVLLDILDKAHISIAECLLFRDQAQGPRPSQPLY